MVSNIEIVSLLSDGVGGSFYPLRFPTNSPDASSQVEITPTGGATVGGVGRMNVQVITRDAHPSYAESKALTIRSYLNDKADFLLAENVQVVLVKAQEFSPMYLGTDENGRHLFSHNYNFIMGVQTDMSKKISGIDVLVSASVDGGTTNSVIGGQSGATLNRSTNVIEVTAKDSGGWAENISGIRSWSVECEGFMVKDDAALDSLETAWENGDPVDVSLSYNGNDYEGQAVIAELPNEFPQDDAVTFSLSLTGTGALTKTAQA